MTTQQLFRAIVRSELVDEEMLRRALGSIRIKHGGELPDNAKTVAKDLVVAGLITKWQSTHLLSGRWRGFFLGKYKLIKLLGAGGMGSVYLAEHTVMNKRLAIKVLPKEAAQKATSLQRFQAEARTAAMLDHPHIVRTVDIDEVKGRHFIVMEYIDGSDLDRKVRKSGPLSVVQTVEYFRQATLGLQHAHERGVLHRDVKPLNMLLNREGVLKISDLGLARLRFDAAEENGKRRIVGTADYISPEQSLGSLNVDSRADLYSLGCTLFFMLTGRPPYTEGGVAERIAAHQLAPPPDLAELRPDCPEELVAIYERLMAKQAEDRFQTATDLLSALDRLASRISMSGSGVHAVPQLAVDSLSHTSQATYSTADPLFDTDASGGLSGAFSGAELIAEALSDDEAGGLSGLDLGSFPAEPINPLKPPMPKKAEGEDNKQKYMLFAGLGMAAVAIVLSLSLALSGKKDPSYIKATEGDSRIIVMPNK